MRADHSTLSHRTDHRTDSRKLAWLLIVLLLSVGLTPASTVLAGSYHTGIVPDGILSAGEWQADEVIAKESGDDANLNTAPHFSDLDELSLTWDSESLYILVKGRFPTGDGRGFASFLDVNYGAASNRGLGTISTLAETSTAVTLNRLLGQPNWAKSDTKFKPDYAIGSVQAASVSSEVTSTLAGLRSWGGDGGNGGFITATLPVLGAAVQMGDGVSNSGLTTYTVAEIVVPWRVLYANLSAGKVITGAIIGLTVGQARNISNTLPTLGTETLPSNGTGTSTSFTAIYTVTVDANLDGYPDVGVQTGNSALAVNGTANASRPNNAVTYSAAKQINARLDDWQQNEFIGAGIDASSTPSLMRYHVTWDADTIYVGFAGNGSGLNDSTASRFNVAIDLDAPCTIANAPDMALFDGVSFNNDAEPDVIYQWRDEAVARYTPSGTTWSTASSTASGSDSNTNPAIVELRIPRSELGLMVNGASFYLWAADENGADFDAYVNTPDAANPNVLTQFARWSSLGSGVNVNAAELGFATCVALSDAQIDVKVEPTGNLLPGQPVTYTLTYANASLGIANNVVITDQLPSQLEVIDTSGGVLSTQANRYVWTLGNLAANASGVFTVTGTLNSTLNNNTILTNTAQIRASNDPITSNNQSTVINSLIVPQLSFSSATATVNETESPLNLVVSQNLVNPYAETRVDYVLTGGSAQDNVDFTYQFMADQQLPVLFIPSGETQTLLPISIVNDELNEPTEIFTATLINPRGSVLVAPNKTVISLIDDDAPPAISIVDFTDSEDSEIFQVAIALNRPTAFDVTGVVTVSDGTATMPGDYSAVTSQPFTITAGSTTFYFPVTIIDDIFDEPDETFTLGLSNVTNVGVSDGFAVGTIVDNDEPPTLSVANLSVNEGAGNASVVATLSAPHNANVSVMIATQNGSATSPADYSATAFNLTIPTGETQASGNIPLADDALDESNESFIIQVTSATLQVSTPQAIVTILDNDAPPTLTTSGESANEGNGNLVFVATLNTPSGLVVSGLFTTTNGSAKTPADYGALVAIPFSIPAGMTQAEVLVPIVEDTLHEVNETVALETGSVVNAVLSSGVSNSFAIGTIVDNDPEPSLSISDASALESSGSLVFTLTLNTPSGVNVSGLFTTNNGTAIAPDDYTAKIAVPFEIPAGNTQVAIHVLIIDDVWDEVDKTISAIVDNVVGATVTDGEASGLILDDDLPPAVSVADVSLNEGGGTMVVTLSLDHAGIADVSGQVDTVDETATAGVDYQAFTAQSFTIAAGATATTLSLPITNDLWDEDDETFAIRLSNVTGADIADGNAQATLLDDDLSPNLSMADISRNEDGGDLIFTISLDAVSARTVSGIFSTQDGSAVSPSDYTAQIGVAFTIPAGQTRTTINVATHDDASDEIDETFSANLTSVLNASVVDGTAIGTILDNDLPPTLTIADASTNESTGTLAFTVTLSAASGQTISGLLNTTNGNAMAPNDYEAQVNVPFSIPAGNAQFLINVPVVNDTDLESTERFTVTLSNVNGATLTDGVAVGTISDDDSTGTGRLIIMLNMEPESTQNVLFKTNKGTSFYLDDEANGAQSDTITKTQIMTLTPGIYTVTQSVPYSWILTDITCTGLANTSVASKNAQVMVLGGNQNVICTFTNQRAVTIQARAYNDTNRNGIYDAIELGIAGVTVNVFPSLATTTDLSQTTTTVGKVNWTSVLTPSSYTVCAMTWPISMTIVQPTTLHPTYNKPCYDVSLPPSMAATVYFGLRLAPVTAADAEGAASEPTEAENAQVEAGVAVLSILIDGIETLIDDLKNGVVYWKIPEVVNDTAGYEEQPPADTDLLIPLGGDKPVEATIKVFLPMANR